MKVKITIGFGCLVACLCMLPHSSSAQTYRIRTGRLVRLTVEEAAGRTQLQGIVRRSNEDTLRIRLSHPSNRLRAVPLDAIHTLQMSMGRNRAAGTALGAFAGFGAVTGSLLILSAVAPDGSDGPADGQGGALNSVAAVFWGVVVGAPWAGLSDVGSFRPGDGRRFPWRISRWANCASAPP
jgi:hypothetical protein